jgi:PPK2 family polyphosphate:nucleotide phosphotransferase
MKLRERLIVPPGSKVKLAKWNPADTAGFDKKSIDVALAHNLKRLGELQYRLYAESRRSLLIILQGIDAGGKDGTIRHVCVAMNPQGCRVAAFKVPTPEEAAHDFLWRIHRQAPRTGEVVIFNRSHYEDVLVVRVHGLVPKPVWQGRYERINEFEAELADSRVHVLKFFLHISKDEQLERFQDRLDDPAKNWKASPADFAERKFWADYTVAYEDALSKCSTKAAPWFVIPSNHKWFRNLAVSQIIVETLEDLNMKFPKPAFDLSKIKLK